jgi:hypothetical protein
MNMMKALNLSLVLLSCLAPNLQAAAPFTQGRVEQEALIRRAERLQRQMEKMKLRYQKEGKKEYVALLNEGLRWISESQLIRKMNETSLAISSKERRAIPEAKKVLGDIDKLLSILLDRRSIEDLEKETKSVEKQIQTLKRLQKQQEELKKAMKKVREASRTKEEVKITQELMDLAQRERDEARKNIARAGSLQSFLEKAIDQIQKLQKETKAIQEQLDHTNSQKSEEQAQKATRLFRETQKEIARLEAAKSLERAMKELTQQPKPTNSSLPPSFKTAQERMEHLQESFSKGIPNELKKRWDKLKSVIEKGRTLSPETQKHLRKFLETFDTKSRQNRKALAKQTETLRSKTQTSRSKTDSRQEKTAKSLENAAKHLRKSTQDVSKKEALLQTGKALQDLMDAIASSSQIPVEERVKELKRKAENLTSGLEIKREQTPHLKPNIDKTIESLKKTIKETKQLKKSENLPKNTQLASAKEIEKSLKQAKASLQEALNKLKKRVSGKSLEGARDQANLQKQLTRIAKELKKAQANGKLSSEQLEGAIKNLQQANTEMQRAQSNLQKASPSKASQNQNRAAQSLEKAARELARKRKPGERGKAEMNRLAKKQEELEQEILRLAQRINPRKNSKAKQALEEAAKAANKAKKAMQSGQMEQSQKEQEKASKKLEEARKDLEDERDRYWRLRQEELLFRIGEEVGVLIHKQKELNRKTLDLAGEAGNAERLPRRLRTRIRALGRAEKELEVRARFLAENLKKEQTLVFTFVLESIADDLSEIGRTFSSRRPRVGSFVQGLQMEVLSRLKMLKDSLEEEQKKKKQEKKSNKQNKGKPNSNQGDSKPKLVPDVAELRMLKRLELATKRRIDTFLNLQETLPGGLGELQTDALKRLALRHAKVSDLFQTFLKTRGLLNSQGVGKEKEGVDRKNETKKKEKKD